MKKKRPRINKQTDSNLINRNSFAKKKSPKSLASLKKLKQRINRTITILESEIENSQKKIHDLKNSKKTLINIENTFKNNKLSHQLKYNVEYRELKKIIKQTKPPSIEKYRIHLSKLKRELINVENEISQLANVMTVSDNNKSSVNVKKNPVKSKLPKANTNSEPLSIKEAPKKPVGLDNYVKETIEIEWDNVYFYDDKIIIKHNRAWYEKHVPKSKKYLNEIKHYYKFHNVPKLKVILKNQLFHQLKMRKFYSIT